MVFLNLHFGFDFHIAAGCKFDFDFANYFEADFPNLVAVEIVVEAVHIGQTAVHIVAHIVAHIAAQTVVHIVDFVVPRIAAHTVEDIGHIVVAHMH